VIREPRAPRRGRRSRGTRSSTPATDPSSPASPTPATLETAGWDLSAITEEEVVAVRRFLERRGAIDARARLELAHRLEGGLRAKVSGVPSTPDPESFLEALARAKSAR
jgi:hypothetical protein